MCIYYLLFTKNLFKHLVPGCTKLCSLTFSVANYLEGSVLGGTSRTMWWGGSIGYWCRTGSKEEDKTTPTKSLTRRPRGRPWKNRVDQGSTNVPGAKERSALVIGVEQGSTPQVTGAASRKRDQPSRKKADTTTVVGQFNTEYIANRVNKRKKQPGKLLSIPYQPN